MLIQIKKLIFIFSFNSCLFLLLIIGIQNSANKSKVNLIVNQTVMLPIGFIIGSSFIGGSLLGSLLTINIENRTKKKRKTTRRIDGKTEIFDCSRKAETYFESTTT